MDPNVNKALQIVCMVCGILSIVNACSYGIGVAFAIAALIMASKISAQTGGELAAMPKVGKICGIIGLPLSIIGGIIMIVLQVAGTALSSSSYVLFF